jgi:predicted DNA-binding protein (MmcQ/YjbR family)
VAITDDHTPDAQLARIRSACLGLNGVTEAVAWGDPVFLVAGRAFAGFGLVVPWGPSLRLRMGKARQQSLLQDSRFFPTPRLLHRGWVSLKLGEFSDWEMVGELVNAAYALAARPGTLN